MMDFKTVVSQFKAKQSEAGKPMVFSLLPLVMAKLIENGLNVSHMTATFYQELAAELFGDKPLELQLYAVDALALLGNSIPAPKVVEEQEVLKPKPVVKEAIVIDYIIKTDHLVDNIPDEDDEGDPFHTPPEERISLRPEDLAPLEYDEDFCKLIGVDTSKRQGR